MQFIANILLLSSILFGASHLTAQTLSIQVTDATNCSICNGSLQAELDAGELADFEWYDSQGGLLFSETTIISSLPGLCAGVYSVVVTVNGESIEEWMSVGSNPDLVGEVAVLDVCSSDSEIDLISVLNPLDVTGTWSDTAGIAFNGVLEPSSHPGGLYVYEIDDGSCLHQSGVVVNIIQHANPGLTTTYLICENYEAFFMTDLLAGSPDPGGEWFASGSIPMNGVFDPATMDTDLFTYLIDTVVGCPPIYSTLFVLENALPDPGISATVEVCPNAFPFDLTSALLGTPDAGGLWTDELGNDVSNVFDPLVGSSGVFTYEVNGDAPCPNLESELTVNFTDGVDSGEPAALIVCEDDAVIDLFSQLGGTPDLGGFWTNSIGELVDQFVDPSLALTETYLYTVNSVGCLPVSTSVEVSIENLPFAGMDNNLVLCENIGQYDLSLSLDPLADQNGQWTNSSGDVQPVVIDLEVNASHQYSYTVSGVVCPEDVALINVQVDEMPQINPATAQTYCDIDVPFDLQDFVPPGQIVNWTLNGGELTSSILDPSTLTSGQYIYEVESQNTCPNLASSVNIQIEEYGFTPSSDLDAYCYDGLEVDLNTYLPVAVPMGDWFDDLANPISNLQIPQPGSSTFEFVNNDFIVCPAASFVLTFDISVAPNPGIGGTFEYCFDGGEISLQTLLQDEDLTGSWTFQGQSIQELIELSESSSGSYVYTVDGIGTCPEESAAIVLEINPGVEFDAGLDAASCAGSDAIELGQVSTSNAFFSWSPSDNLSDVTLPNPTYSFVNETDGVIETDYVVLVSNGICEQWDTVSVTVYPIPNPDVADIILCQNETVQLGTGETGAHSWFPPGIFDSSVSPSPIIGSLVDQSCQVSVTNIWGCVSTDSFELEVLESPHVNFDVTPNEGCAPLVVSADNLSVNDLNVDYFWSLETGETWNEDAPTLVFYEEGTHDLQLVAIAENGCADTVSQEGFIIVHPLPQASFELDESSVSSLFPQVGTTNLSIGADYYYWSTNDDFVSSDFAPELELPINADEDHWICLESHTQFGCVDSTCHPVHVFGEYWIYAPNAFTPDEDGYNESFSPVIRGADLSTYELSIFNRWGELVFKTNDIEEGWIGNHQGSGYFVPNDTYVWVVKVRDLYSADWKKETGHVTIIR